jgi:zinc/manganese transport system substrate-binding protein
MMKRLMTLLTAVLVGVMPGIATADLRILACEPEWGSLAQELGGDAVTVVTATTAQQDPHHIQARPSLIARARRAGLVVCTGAELEIGWLPLLLRQGNNPAIQPGQPGYFLAADYVPMLGVPTRVDRAEGDIHPAGNPHIQTDPRNIARVATALADRFATLDPAHATDYQAHYQSFADRWQAAIVRWEAQAAPLRGVPIVVHHTSWLYLTSWLGLRQVGTLEEKPGVPPSSAHLARLLVQLHDAPARCVVRAPYQDPRPSEWLAQRAKIPAVVLPFTVGGTDGAADLFGLFDDTISQLLEATR